MKGKLFLYHLKGTQRNKPVPLKDTSYLRLRLTEIKNIPFSSSKILTMITYIIIIVNTVFLALTYFLQKMSPLFRRLIYTVFLTYPISTFYFPVNSPLIALKIAVSHLIRDTRSEVVFSGFVWGFSISSSASQLPISQFSSVIAVKVFSA